MAFVRVMPPGITVRRAPRPEQLREQRGLDVDVPRALADR
jgi:hypothetical protein